MSNPSGIDSRAGERGAVKVKTLLTFTVLAAAAFTLIKVVPVYVEQRQVIYEVNELARVAAIRSYKADKMNKDIEKLRRDFDLPESSVNYETANNGVKIKLVYSRNIDFLVTTYTWQVDYTTVGKEM